MGRVYIAEHLGWKVKMAIKAPRPEVLADKEGFKRILNEANSWVSMGMHPNVATCYYALNIEEVPYLFIEFVDGGDLSSWIKSGRCEDIRTILSLAIQFCHGMEFTHSKGIIHRDIKPGNILITQNTLLKITDFGIIQNIKDTSKNIPLQEGTSEKTTGFRGTPGYASPEQFKDTHSVDKRSDIFSFGVCLWLMLCGHRPFKNNAVPGKATPSPKNKKEIFPPILSELLLKSVAFDRDDRYSNFKDLRGALNAAHIALFRVPCPFMELDFSDLQAENYNNRAISLLELDKQEEGEKYLQKALDIDDTLTEAIFNYTLMKWQKGTPPERLLKQIKASQARQPEAVMLNTLSQTMKCDLLQDVWADDTEDLDEEYAPLPKKQHFPEYLLCLPKNTLDIFRNNQMLNATKANINDLLDKKEYKHCYKILSTVWKNCNYKKDNSFVKTYENLLKVGKKQELLATIRLRTIRNLKIPARKLLCIPKTNKFFTLCQDGRVVVRNYAKSSKINTLGKYKSITTTVLSSDGSFIGIGFSDTKVDVLSLNSGKTTCSFDAGAQVTALSFSDDSKYIAAGCKNGLIKTVPVIKDSKEIIEISAGEGNAISSLIHFNNGNDFAAGCEDGQIRHWFLGEQDPGRIINAHAMPVTILSAADNGLHFVSGSADRSIKIWDRQTGQCMKTIMAHEDNITSAMVLPDSDYFVTASDDDIIKFWNISTGESAVLMDGRSDGLTALASGPRPHIFCSGGKDGAIIFWMAIYDLEFH